jgi:Tfp pilus assembly protein PilF
MEIVRTVLLLLCIALTAAGQAVDPGDEYFRAFMLNSEAERLVTAGEVQRGLEKHEQASIIFDAIAQAHPTWQSTMLNFRRQRVKDAIANARAKLSAVPQPVPMPQIPNPQATIPQAPLPQTTIPIPQAPLPPGAPMAPTQPQTASTGDPVEDAIENLRRAQSQKQSQLQQQLLEAKAKVGDFAMAYDTMLKQRDEAVRQRDGYYTQAATLQQNLATQQAKTTELERQVAAGSASKQQLEAARKELAETQSSIADTKSRMAKAETAVMNTSKQLAETTMRLEATQKERDAAQSQLKVVQTENDQLKKNINMSGNTKTLIEENNRLKKELESAQKQIVSLKADSATKDQEITALKGQLTKIQTEITALRRENGELETRVASLTIELKRIIDPKNAKTENLPPLMAENQVLKDIIMRQLRIQSRQQEQKKLIIEDIKKHENDNKALLDQVELLAGARMTLTADEQKLFTTPQLKEIMGSEGIAATLIAKAESKAGSANSPTKEQNDKAKKLIDDLVERANTELNDKKFVAAEKSYEEVLRADAKNATAFAGLAWARIQQNKLDEAEATLQKSLAFDPDNGPGHYMLAVTLFRRSRLNEAITSFDKSLSLEPKNARAHHYLGVIASQQGINDKAEREFKTALAIEPGYGEADFNLAVLYATSTPPDWDKAQKHYDEALKKGVKADPNLKQILDGRKKPAAAKPAP